MPAWCARARSRPLNVRSIDEAGLITWAGNEADPLSFFPCHVNLDENLVANETDSGGAGAERGEAS